MSNDNFISVDWPAMKSFVDSRNLSMQWILNNGSYYIKAMDGFYSVETIVHTDGDMPSEKTDFEDNYKAKGNKPQGSLKVKIEEESRIADTQGIYKAKGYFITTTATTGWQSKTFSFPYPISLFSAEWSASSAHDGDEVEFRMAQNTAIGVITSNVAIGDTVINVSQTVIDNIKIGYYVNLLDSPTTEADLTEVIDIDATALTITLASGVANAYVAATPTYVLMTLKMIETVGLEAASTVSLGKDTVGGSFIPANTPLDIFYNNIDGTIKTFRFIMEFKY